MQPLTPSPTALSEAPRGRLAELLRSLPGVQPVAQHEALAGIDARLLFRGWAKSTPAVSILQGHGTEAERGGWLRDAIAALGVTDRCYVGVGSGRDWLEIELAGRDHGSRVLDLILHTGTVHNSNLPFVDVCLLAAELDSVLVIRKTEHQMAAFIFRDLHEKHRAQLRSREESRMRHLADYRRKLEAVQGLIVHDAAAAHGALPGGETLSWELERPFDLPHIRGSNEQDREHRDRWIRDRLASTAFAAPKGCFFWQGGKNGGPWWRLELPGRQDWASGVLYAIAGRRAGDQWSKWLQWSEQFLFLSSDATMVMSWEVTEHSFHIHVYPAGVLLERARSRSRLATWLAAQKDMLVWASDRSGVRARDVFRCRWQIESLHGGASRVERDRWLFHCLCRRHSPRYEENLLAPGQRAQFNGSARLSIGTTILPWTQVFWRDTTWLPRLWDELRPDHLFIEGYPELRKGCSGPDDPVRVLGIRRTARTYEAFLCAPPKRRASR